MIRKLAAIMFTDMVGYTALMQVDEAEAKARRDRQRDVLEESIARHGGQVLQVYGDGTLSTFDSAVEAVRCAVEIQSELRADPPIPLRIGIHAGDVVHDEHGVYGDGVNVASRIQGLSVPGGVLISEKVFDEVKNHPEIRSRSLGHFNLKHVNQALRVHAVIGDGMSIPSEEVLAGKRARNRRSIAVLPFVNMSADAENEFFSDGITEEIINALTKICGLQVTARTSSFAFKQRTDDIRAIAEQLGVTHVLEGSVRRAGNRVRVTAQLICAADGFHLFSETYERELEDIFAVQDDISRTIVAALTTHLGPSDRPCPSEPVVRSHSHDTEAYSEYLRGRSEWARFTAVASERAIGHFDRSIELDPECALPYTGLASAYVFLGATGALPSSRAFPLAERAALRALELEPDAGECHVALAAVKLFFHWDVSGAYDALQKALSLTPGTVEVHHMYGIFLEATGHFDEAVAEMRAAVDLDPLGVSNHQSLAKALLAAGRLSEAREAAQHALEMDPAFRAATETLGWIHVAEGDLGRACQLFERLPQQAGVASAGASSRGYVYGKLGREEDARRMMALLVEYRSTRPELGLEMEFATIHLGSGKVEAALGCLRQAFDARLATLVSVASSPRWQELRGHLDFKALVHDLGLVEELEGVA